MPTKKKTVAAKAKTKTKQIDDKKVEEKGTPKKRPLSPTKNERPVVVDTTEAQTEPSSKRLCTPSKTSSRAAKLVQSATKDNTSEFKLATQAEEAISIVTNDKSKFKSVLNYEEPSTSNDKIQPSKRKRSDSEESSLVKMIENEKTKKTFEKAEAPDTHVDLPLPLKYKKLEDLFNALETTCGYLETRRQICSFPKLQKGIQSMCNKNLSLKQLSQIYAVFPEGYHFKTVTESFCVLRVPSSAMGKGLNTSEFTSVISTENEIVKRRKEFHDRLIERVNKLHAEFIQAKNLKVELNCWHKDFPLEGVPEVEERELPLPKMLKHSKQEVQKIEREKIKKFLQQDTQQSNKPQSALAKVIQREQQLKQESSDAGKRKLLLSRLPDLCDYIRAAFTLENKNSMARPILIDKLITSQNGKYSKEELAELLSLLFEVVPDWCGPTTVGSSTDYVRLQKQPLEVIKKRIKEAV